MRERRMSCVSNASRLSCPSCGKWRGGDGEDTNWQTEERWRRSSLRQRWPREQSVHGRLGLAPGRERSTGQSRPVAQPVLRTSQSVEHSRTSLTEENNKTNAYCTPFPHPSRWATAVCPRSSSVRRMASKKGQQQVSLCALSLAVCFAVQANRFEGDGPGWFVPHVVSICRIVHSG